MISLAFSDIFLHFNKKKIILKSVHLQWISANNIDNFLSYFNLFIIKKNCKSLFFRDGAFLNFLFFKVWILMHILHLRWICRSKNFIFFGNFLCCIYFELFSYEKFFLKKCLHLRRTFANKINFYFFGIFLDFQ